MHSPRITFCTGVGTVTGANFLFEVPSQGEESRSARILVDCGLVQGERVANQENHEAFLYDPSTIDALFVTHAHLDHVGRIPKLVKEGFKGVIYSTPQTREIAELILADAVNILAMEARQDGLEPLYDEHDVAAVFPLWKTIPYHEVFNFNENISVFLKDAGHILGSSMFEFHIKESGLKVLFTGDLGNSPAPLLRDTETPGAPDYVIMESVYGDRNHEEREERTAKLEQVIKDTISRQGTLVIPTFSVDRTQVILYELNNLVEQGQIPSIPVFVDSPLATKVTEVYKRNTDLFNPSAQEQIRAGDNLFEFPHLKYTFSAGQSREIDTVGGAKIILAGSGMSVGGRVISHEESYLPDANSTILFVGYQAAGSLGRQIVDGAKKVNIHGRTVPVKAHIEQLLGYSAHKDGDHLVEFVSQSEKVPQSVFVVMGEPKSSMHLAQRLTDELGVKALMPERGKPYEL